MVKLRLATREQETFENAFRAQIADYQRLRPDVEIEVVARPIADHAHEMLAGGGCKSGEFDLFLCCTDWVAEAMATESVVDLAPYIEKNPPHDWPHGWHPAMRGIQHISDKIIGLPWHDGPEVFHYRADLFENPAEQANYKNQTGRDLEVPKTWDDFVEVAKFFTRPKQDQWGQDQWGTVVAGYTDGHNNVYDFLIQLWSRGGELLDAEGKPAFDSEIGVQSLEFCRDLIHNHCVASPDCLRLGSVEAGDYYASGRAAMMINWSGFAARCPSTVRSLGKTGVRPYPPVPPVRSR
jgi:multiple sugar transport system substrate-binding protein